MPKENCPQVHAWCPHYDSNNCKLLSDMDDPCIHARSIVGLRAQLSDLMTVCKDPEIKSRIESLLETMQNRP